MRVTQSIKQHVVLVLVKTTYHDGERDGYELTLEMCGDGPANIVAIKTATLHDMKELARAIAEAANDPGHYRDTRTSP